MKSKESQFQEVIESMRLKKSEETILSNEKVLKPKNNVKKKKIIIITLKKDPLNEMSQRISSEGDFIKTISGLIKTSENCRKCQSIKTTKNKEYFCTNFEALWYHRDSRFANFSKCIYYKPKNKAVVLAR